ncbi:MAG: AhpC/TSA family protein [Chitinophagaceae bacterium]|nr:AhpC/TSA family protein [Chitinophagaceae bacterium]
MKKIFPILGITLLLFSCKNGTDNGKFVLSGELKSTTDQKIYLEELFFSEQQPEVLDTGEIKNGKFTVSAVAPEEGLFRLRNEAGDQNYIFINDGPGITFTADAANPEVINRSVSGPANSSLKKLLLHTDSIGKMISAKYRLLAEFTKAGIPQTDSIFIATSDEFNQLNEQFNAYCFGYADSAKSPVVSLYAATMPPVEISKFEAPVTALTKRFPKHQGIANALVFIKSKATAKTPAPAPATPNAGIGSMAPELTMNDVNDKPFSLSQLRGKYVLVDFWASWCAPCREENPNVVAAFNQFKDKNFTVLGVSLDKNKQAWINAIKEDHLNWQHISDLQYWSSAAIPLYGFDGIPYNVLVDPQGKIIATGLRESALQNKLAEVL